MRPASRRSFIDVFRRSNKFSEVQAVCRSLNDSPLVGLFQAGYTELTAQLRQPPGAEDANRRPRPANLEEPDSRGSRTHARVGRRSQQARETHSVPGDDREHRPVHRPVRHGLGHHGAFEGIGQTGSTNLGVVAPGIAEALVATAVGSVAAIPAVYFYNHLTQRVKMFASEMDDFAMEFLNIVERNFT